MKITRNQLKKIIKEEMATINDEAIEDAVMGVLSDEGGAAGLEPIEAELEDLETDDISLPDEPIEDIIGGVAGVKRHADGDYVDTTQLEGRLLRMTESQLRRIIHEKKKGLWANIHAKKKRGEKSDPRSKEYQAAKKAGQKINKESNSKLSEMDSRAMFELEADERARDELATQIRHASKDIHGYKDHYDLRGKSIEELEDILYDLANSPEQRYMDDEARIEMEDKMGYDSELSRAEMAPRRQGMSRRPGGSKSQRRMESRTGHKQMRLKESDLRELVREAILSEGRFADIVRGVGKHGSKLLTRPAGIIAKAFGRLATSRDTADFEDRIDANVKGLEQLVGDLLYLPGRSLEVGYEELKKLVKKYKPDARDDEIQELEKQIEIEKKKSPSQPARRGKMSRRSLAAESRIRRQLRSINS